MVTKISVIVPVYNTEMYLGKCISSLIRQTLSGIEIIIVNDGSDDNSQKIIDKYADMYPGNIFKLKQDNKGLGAARNIGIRHAKGEYIGFVDSDDFIAPNMYELMYNIVYRTEDDIVICDYHNITEDFSKSWLTRGWHGKKEFPEQISDFILDSTHFASACNKIFKRSLFHDVFFLENHYYEDIATIPIILSYCNKISYLNKPLYYYFQRENSITHQANNTNNLQVVNAWSRCLNKCNPKYKIEIQYAIYYSICEFIDFKKEYAHVYMQFVKDNINCFQDNQYIRKAIKTKEMKNLLKQ